MKKNHKKVWIFALLACFAVMVAVLLGSGEAKAAGQTGTVTAGPLNVRSGYGTSNPVLTDGGSKVQLSKGTKVDVLDSEKVGSTTWYKVEFTKNGKDITGCVSGDYLSVSNNSGTNSDNSGETGTVTAGPLNVRSGYGTGYEVLKENGSKVQLSKGTTVTILESKNVSGTTWYKVTFTRSGKTITGHVSGDYVRVGSASLGSSSNDNGSSGSGSGNATVTGGPLNVRKGYGTSYDVMYANGRKLQLAKGTKVTAVEYKTVGSTNWYKVTFTKSGESYTGFVSGDYLNVSGSVSKYEEPSDDDSDKKVETPAPAEPIQGDAWTVTEEEYDLLCRIVQAEAGDQSSKGKTMVANVVLNRVSNSRFPSSIYDVIYQTGQFSPVKKDSFATLEYSDSVKEAVDVALDGLDYSNGALFFCMKSSAGSFESRYTKCAEEGDHVFFKY